MKDLDGDGRHMENEPWSADGGDAHEQKINYEPTGEECSGDDRVAAPTSAESLRGRGSNVLLLILLNATEESDVFWRALGVQE